MKSLFAALCLMSSMAANAEQFCTFKLSNAPIFGSTVVTVEESTCPDVAAGYLSTGKQVPGGTLTQAVKNVTQEMYNAGYRLQSMSSAMPIHSYILVYFKFR